MNHLGQNRASGSISAVKQLGCREDEQDHRGSGSLNAVKQLGYRQDHGGVDHQCGEAVGLQGGWAGLWGSGSISSEKQLDFREDEQDHDQKAEP